ncbi:MAG: beta-ketoacyl-ACP synthase II [Clostridiales Family XIII bacterium]|jgi:3-oxoacyl-[acyl-carrier-protein] synthase II|nr:beta-ketoacyl-ACP synthase II [Clostridiales Family XIII bacterium]
MSNFTRRRVVITGLGTVTAVGNNVADTWDNIKAGKNGIGPITKLDTSVQKVKLGAEVKDYVYHDKKEARRLDLVSQYAITAAIEAFAQSGLVAGENIDANRVFTYVSTGIGGIMTLEEDIKDGYAKGFRHVSPLLVPMIIGNMVAGNVAIQFGLKGSALDIVTACATGTDSIGQAFRAIRDGYAEAAVAGGSEAPFAPVCFAGFCNMKAMNTTEDPNRASIPFDKERGGFIMGEGAGILILEEYEHAKARGANILGEVVGYGSSCDAYHITKPHPEGEGGAAAMQAAVDDAAIDPSAVNYINAHGTSTPYNDLFETRAIKKVFGDAAYKLAVSSTKSMTGHGFGAAGAIEALLCVKAIEDQILPPTINHKVPDPELDLDYVTTGARPAEINYTLSNSLGFGGHNGTIIIKKFED